MQRVKYRILRTLSSVHGDLHVAEACMAIYERLRNICSNHLSYCLENTKAVKEELLCAMLHQARQYRWLPLSL